MIKSIDEVRIEGKRVLVRVDFNVPLDDERHVTDDTRIKESLPTIDKIIDYGSIPVLMSHLGRPKGEVNLKYSLKPAADLMIDKYGYDVIFSVDCIGEPALQAVKEATVGQVVLLENLRFHKEEEKNDLEFAKKLASLGDAYINDAFGSAHRAHASTEAVAKLFETRLAGYLMINEIEYLGKTVMNPVKPFVAVLGGAKISGKIDVIKNLLGKCNSILIGGGMAYTFFKAMGYNIGKSLLEEDRIMMAKDLINEAKAKNVNLILPVDTVVADYFSNDSEFKVVNADSIPDGWMGMDIGPETQKIFNEEISRAKTIVWNGPMGVFEMDNFAQGTYTIARSMADVTANGATTIVGGGDSAAAINKMKFQNKVTHVSTGGGASLEYLEGKILPGVAALEI
ncbi:MAG: phosphoglycerate kinase [Ignavibacteriae bacterium]|nr:phosphoglycerate kinase [Ignavibacteriota bacterium]